MFNSATMKFFELNTIVPPRTDWGNLIGNLLIHILRIYAIRDTHDFKRIWLHE